MTMDPLYTPAVLFTLVVMGGFGVGIGAILASRAKIYRKRSRRALAIHLRMETAWKNARMGMYLAGPIGRSNTPGTKYSNDSTNRDFVRYIGG
jgi:hypothetical protein